MKVTIYIRMALRKMSQDEIIRVIAKRKTQKMTKSNHEVIEACYQELASMHRNEGVKTEVWPKCPVSIAK